MTSVPPPSITESRSEVKYRLAASRASAFANAVQAHLAAHHFSGGGASPLPRARHYTTTVYFDTPSLALYRAVLANESNLKLRAREYYDLHPELLELATDPRQLVRYSPVLWLELKRKVGTRTKKRRLPIPKSEVDAFFETGTISESTRDLQQPGSHETLHELQELRERLGEPLRASCVVNYRRHAWQDGDGDLRVTLDQKLCCFAARPTLFAQTSALVRESLGTPVYEEADCVVEVKARGATPDWLDAALTGGGAEPCAYSKFVTASRAVYGER